MISSDAVLAGSYNYGLVTLSVVIAIAAAYAALDLAGRVTSARGRARFFWLSGGAVAMGIGIWSMHYVGMLAFQLPVPVLYDWPTVLLSLLAAIFASAIALFVVSRKKMGILRASIGSVFMGGGIATMHYTGMAAMRLSAMCHWSAPRVVLSVVFAVVISFVALSLTFYFRGDMSTWSWLKISSAVVMGAAIPIMHYTGMAAATFMSGTLAQEHSDPGRVIDVSALSMAGIIAVTFMVLGLAVLTSLVGRRFSIQASELTASRTELARMNGDLERRVLERTAQLESANESLQAEIAARRQTEGALIESKQLVQAVIDNSPAVIYVKDMQGRYLLINRRYSELFHISNEAIFGKTDHDLFPKDTADGYRAMDQRVAAAATPLTEEEVVTHDGEPHTYVSVKCPLWDKKGKPYAVFGISTDITERKKAEDALRAGEEYTRSVIETALDAVVTIDGVGVITGWNPQAETTFGWKHEEVLGRPLAGIIIPERYRAAHQHGMNHYFSTGQGPVLNKRIELHALHREGREFPVELAITRVRTGNDVAFSAFVRDITERKLAETRVQEQLARLTLLHQITQAIGGRQDLGSINQVVLRSIEEHLRFDFGCICDYDATSQELTVIHVGIGSQKIGLELALTEQAHIPIDANGLSRCVGGQLVYEPDLKDVKMPFPQKLAAAGLHSLVIAPLLVESKVFGVLMAARRRANSFSSGECEFLRQLSEHVALAAHHAELFASLQQAYDDLRQTQQAVMQQERLRALGQMASGIAHDINNAISPMALSTELLLEQEPTLSPRTRRHLEIMQRATDDVANTVARMKDFYRQREPQLTLVPVRMNALVQQVLDLTRARWSDMPQQQGVVIEMGTEFAVDLPVIMGVESEIREALINLVFNAVDAMPRGGTLTLRTRTVEGRPGASKTPNVLVEVADTGGGMNEETRRRCLEPFFTTKGERGTGLGLAMVYGVAQRHGADLEIESAPGEGTVVRLSFAAHVSASLDAAAPVAISAIPSRLRILVVDDDPLIIRALCETLESDGHEVITANGGQAGIDVFIGAQGRGKPFSIVITDLGMPRVDGRKVASFVKSESESTPVILLTGWGQRLMAEGDVPPHVDRVLSKPPKLRDLRDALRLCVEPQRPLDSPTQGSRGAHA
ncbi:MAG: hypothetical protein NVS9B14_00590 [Candidatus Acidiferrum sp.]